ncbi:MAG TPA: hypothetical protein VHV55_01300 [Pirellulales bacterium]|jgi:hypothetical protein|nr:hypothetical protein [Pirellulales bacterium]
MIANVHPIAEVLGELLAQYEARGILAEDFSGREAAAPLPDWNRVSAPLWAEKPGFQAALSVCG